MKFKMSNSVQTDFFLSVSEFRKENISKRLNGKRFYSDFIL